LITTLYKYECTTERQSTRSVIGLGFSIRRRILVRNMLFRYIWLDGGWCWWTALLRYRLRHLFVDWGLNDGDRIRKWLLRASATFRIEFFHDFNFNSKDTLFKENVPHGVVHEVTNGLTGVDHESIGELHALGPSSAQFTRNDDLASLGTALHHEAKNTIACTADSETTEQLVSEGLALGDGGKAAVLDFLGIKLERVFGESEPFLYERRQLTNTTSLLAKNLLRVGSTDDNLGTGVGNTDFAARVSLLCELAGEEFTQFSFEYTIGHELSLLADVAVGSHISVNVEDLEGEVG